MDREHSSSQLAGPDPDNWVLKAEAHELEERISVNMASILETVLE